MENQAAVGSISSNETYLGNRLGFSDSSKIEDAINGRVSIATVARLLARPLVAGIFVDFFVLVLGLLMFAAGADSVGALLTFMVLVPMLVACVMLMIPAKEQLGEWSILLDGRGEAATSAFAAINATLVHRQVPATVEPRRVRTSGSSAVNNHLLVTSGNAQAYISAFEYGTGLFLGWSVWRTRRPITIIFRFFVEEMLGRVGANTDFVTSLRANTLRAFRESVHSATREGVDVAVNDIDVPLQASFGHDIEVESQGGFIPNQHSVPQPAFPPAHAPASASQTWPSAPVPPAQW